MVWGNVGSQQHDHDAICAHNGHVAIGVEQFLGIGHGNG